MDIFGIILQDLAVFHSSVSSTNLILFIFSVSAGSSTFLGQYGRLFTRNTETVIIYCVQLVFKIFHTINYAREVHHGMIFFRSAHFIKQGPHVKNRCLTVKFIWTNISEALISYPIFKKNIFTLITHNLPLNSPIPQKWHNLPGFSVLYYLLWKYMWTPSHFVEI